jgi:hypothetical protein
MSQAGEGVNATGRDLYYLTQNIRVLTACHAIIGFETSYREPFNNRSLRPTSTDRFSNILLFASLLNGPTTFR